ncbi:MAG TPA: RNA polymerase subunit sigma-24 [Verrucomicrobia bacterium]|nr:MAG: RNA polymerase subunit sigma-24 [Lentisphaerae bacterium GWF2_57_35]HBA85466.1 RNA polymerase subunit sigma-24 [Verrucomicrobiota bacterium]
MNTDQAQIGALPLSKEEEHLLLQKALHRDFEAYAQLIRLYHGKIFGLAYNMTGNREDAEDLTQDVFIKAYDALPRFQGQSSFYTWIYRIAVNRAINFLKKTRKRTILSLDDVNEGIERDPAYVELSAKETPLKDVTLAELQEKLNKALLTLSEKHRAVVVLHDIQGLPHEEIAKTLGCSTGTVRSRLFYARQCLQGELAEYLS